MTEGSPPRSPAAGRVLAWVALGLGLCLLLARATLIDLRWLASDSMTPGLERGELVLIWRLGEVEAGDIVLHRLGDDPELYLKRVVAVGGETVEMVGGELLVDGESLATGERQTVDFLWRCQPTQALALVEARGGRRWLVIPGGDDHPAVRVPPDSLWLLGDHRARSRDSRVWGAVASSEVEGTVVARLPGRLRCP